MASTAVDKVEVIPAKTLRALVDFLEDFTPIEPHTIDLKTAFKRSSKYPIDFQDVKGQAHVKRALEVAAAGTQNVLRLWAV